MCCMHGKSDESHAPHVYLYVYVYGRIYVYVYVSVHVQYMYLYMNTYVYVRGAFTNKLQSVNIFLDIYF
jgi:hypothetical protein